MEKKITVIIPVYNTEKYLRECVDCVLNQTMDGIEIILIDDGSPDNSGAICDEYAKTHINVKVIHKHNEGLGVTRNCGIIEAAGEYVAFIDSDDRVSTNYFKILYNKIKEYNADVCYSGGFTLFKENNVSTVSYGFKNDYVVSNAEELKECITRTISSDIHTKDLLPGSSCMSLYKMSFLKKNNLSFISERKFISEDLWFNIDCLSKASCVVYTPCIGYEYRYNNQSLSRGYRKERFNQLYESIAQLEDRCIKLELNNYLGRVNLYFWTNFEKCINQEVKYNTSDGIKNIRAMSELQRSREMLEYLYNNKIPGVMQRLLCTLLYKKLYNICYFLLKVYNLIVNQRQ